VFGDAGKVAARRSDIDLKNLEGTFGIGFRFHSKGLHISFGPRAQQEGSAHLRREACF
jgi:hypothetical protein